MIPFEEINAAATRFDVPAETIEKDYAICWALNCIAASKLKGPIVFYGGTAIKRIYFEDHRFSEDIDLISEKYFDPGDLAQILADSFALARKEANLSLEIDANRTLSNAARAQMFVRFSGYDEIVGAPKEIRIEFDFSLDRLREVFKQKQGFYPSLSVLRPHLHTRMYEERWGTRLKKQIAKLPEIKMVMREIEAKLKEVFE